MRAFSLLMLPLLWTAAIPLSAQDSPDENRAIAEIEKQGGKVGRDEKRPGKPVVMVNLGLK